MLQSIWYLAYKLNEFSHNTFCGIYFYWIIVFLLISLHIIFMFTFFKWYNNTQWIKVASIIFSCIIMILSLITFIGSFSSNNSFIICTLSIIVFVVEILWMLYYLGINDNGRLKYTCYWQIINLIIIDCLWYFARALWSAF